MKKFCFLLLQLAIMLCLFVACAEKEQQDNSNPYADIQSSFMYQEPRTYHQPSFKINDFFFAQCESPTGFCSEH